jgi:hypothetical protein
MNARLFGDKVARIAFGFTIEQVTGLWRKNTMGTSKCAFFAIIGKGGRLA